jgi:hypothetical protein
MNDLVSYYGIRDPFPGELDYFKKNPTVSGMATEDNKIILNPFAALKPEEFQSVAENEAIRLFLKQKGIVPDFTLTKDQTKFFKGTEYEKNTEEAKKTLLARILTGDPSAQATTKEQRDFADKIKGMISTLSAPQYENVLKPSF